LKSARPLATHAVTITNQLQINPKGQVMKSVIRYSILCSAILCLSALTGCESTRMGMRDDGGPPMSMSKDGSEVNCEMHRKMMAQMTPEQREARMAEHMKDMSPEMRARHMEKMRECEK
jgi:hypothetical protein